MPSGEPAQLELTQLELTPVDTVREDSASFETDPDSIEAKKPVIPVVTGASLAPMMQQYLTLSREYPEHLILFQVGDFYEVFFEGAERVSEILGIRLTSRNREEPDKIPMCGVPIHALENYLPRLLQAGQSCVIVSQVEEGANRKGQGKEPGRSSGKVAVRREISRIVTPGVRYEGDGLDEKRFNYLAAAALAPRGCGAVAYIDVSTGRLRVDEIESVEELCDALERIRPSESILPSSLFAIPLTGSSSGTNNWLKRARQVLREHTCHIIQRPFVRLSGDKFTERLASWFPPVDSSGERSATTSNRFGLEHASNLGEEGRSAVNVLLDYIEEVSFGRPPRISNIAVSQSSNVMVIDGATRRNLELLETVADGDTQNALLHRIDYTRTSMGYRMLTDWLLSPIRDRAELEDRYDAVEELRSKLATREEIRSHLATVRDLDRLLSRVTTQRATPRELRMLADSLRELPQIRQSLGAFGSSPLKQIATELDPLPDIYERLHTTLEDEPSSRLNEGEIIRNGFHPEVDRLRTLQRDSGQWIASFESRERNQTGIGSLKVRYNNVFGYFIEVSKTHLAKIPPGYERRQTLVNAERFVTPELKAFELEALSAKARLIEIERSLFLELRSWLAEQAYRIQIVSQQIGLIDVLQSLGHLAETHSYTRPTLVDDRRMEIRSGRHPVVEQVIGAHNFVVNDAILDTKARRFGVLTGPNMGGKSTYLRQIGLIQLLAQIGSFVPAEKASLGIVDRIFTRIGSSDNLSRGESTFMVEMREASSIVKKATIDSLVLIDEIGRGTATTDGLAIATAVAEWLHDRVRCRTVFATHFHELTELSEVRRDTEDGIFSISVGVIEQNGEIVLTHRIEECAADRSYGIEVARLAGMPETLLERAQHLLQELEGKADSTRSALRTTVKSLSGESSEKSLTTIQTKRLETVRDRLLHCDVNQLTPLQALIELSEVRGLLQDRDHD